MNSDQVMRTAQNLYEEGYITYMRTDSINLSTEALNAARHLIKEKYDGIRPAPGYPACPDHKEKDKIWKILDVENAYYNESYWLLTFLGKALPAAYLNLQ